MGKKLRNLILILMFSCLNYFLYILSIDAHVHSLIENKKVLFFIFFIFLNILLLLVFFLFKQRTSRVLLLNRLKENQAELKLFKNEYQTKLNKEKEISETKEKIIYEQLKQISINEPIFKAIKTYKPKKEVFDIGFLIDCLKKINRFSNINIVYVNSFALSIYSYKSELLQVLYNIIKDSQKIFEEKQLNEQNIFIKIDSDEQNLIINLEIPAGNIEKLEANNFFNQTILLNKQNHAELYIAYLIVKNTLKGNLKISNTTIEYKNKKYEGVNFFLTIPKI